MDTYQQIQNLVALIYLLAIIVTLLCCYIVAEPEKWTLFQPKDPDDPTCPLHRRPRSKCDEYHKDD